MSAQEALTIFRRIRKKDIETMGFDPVGNPPKCLILTHLAIPPPHVRPTISFGMARSEDDVTAKLLDIIKTNIMVKKLVDSGAGEDNIMEFAKLLQYHIYTLNDNCIIGIPQATTKSKRPLKSIRERLKSKEGRLRGTLMGKRVDYCARSVIGGDPNLNTEQVGVPRSVALNLTFPERVTPHNIDKLRGYIRNGPVTWPGARFVVQADNTRQDLRYVKDLSKVELKYGWVVERHMLDGDYIIFNRQPSLHKMSMMGHRVKVMPFSTLRFNLAVTSPYNADFDGDEMNLHLGQSHETRAEIKLMMLNPRMLVSPQGNKPVMGVVQDSLLATTKYTKRDTYLEKDLAMNILMWLPVWDGQLPIPSILKPKELWTGKQIFSKLLPTNLDLVRDSAIASKNKKDDMNFSASDCRVVIQNGELLCGIVCKKTIGANSGGLLHLIWLDNGPDLPERALVPPEDGEPVAAHNGFSCGVADIIANDETLLSVEKTLKQAKIEVRKILADAQRGKLETQPGKTMYQSFEAKVNQRLNAAREDAGNIGSNSLDERNNIISMVNAGSKGSPINIAQIIACVGQQNVEGARIKYGFNDRTLPHFTKDDYGAESRGFVENSYLAGLTPQEVWMHAMGGREGVIDTACKTSETGYIQRRLVKSMETLKIAYDGTSRNANEDIIQFLYGEDGMDGLWVEDQTLEIMTYDNASLEHTFKHDHRSEKYGVDWLPAADVLNYIKGDRPMQEKLDAEWCKLKELKETICQEVFIDGDNKQHFPINIARMITRAKMRTKLEDPNNLQQKYTPWEVVDLTEELMSQLEVTRAIAEGDTIGREVEDNAKIILNAHVRCHLGSKKILMKDGLTKQSFDWLRGEIKQRFMKACAHPGETIGVLAAQSVGEPATQMTLNTFHFAGVGAKNVTLGVPRLKEIINVAKAVRTPSLAVFLTGDLGKEQERAKDVQSMLEHTTLQKVTSFTQIFWDPDPVNTRVKEDQEWVQEYYELPDEEGNPDRLGAWVLRIQLSNKVMTDKKLTVREVGERIQNDFLGDIDCIFTDDNAEELVLRIRLLKEPADIGQPAEPFNPHDDKEDKDFKFLRSIEANILKEMTLKGIIGIKKVFMREETINEYNKVKGKFERHKEWVLDTDGVNMEEVMLLPEVDFKRLQSNDIVEILKVLGIEATRKALLFHIRMVISFDGSYVNYRHMGTMCDVMSNRGHLMAITRHGINRTNMGPWMKCSFEETVEILMDAAIYNEVDHMRSVSENIIFGQLCPIGTGAFEVYMDDNREAAEGVSEDMAKCALDEATPVLQSSLKKELFSLSSPAATSKRETPIGEDTPAYQDGDMEFAQTNESLRDIKSGEVELTPGEDDEEGTMRVGSLRSPFETMSPMGDRDQRMDDTPASPASPGHTVTSPTYSPAIGDDQKQDTSPDGLSPTYSAQSPAYTASSSRGGTTTPGARLPVKQGRGGGPYSTSPAYQDEDRSRKSHTTTSPAYTHTEASRRGKPKTSPFYSPMYSVSPVSGAAAALTHLTSPAYTPLSPDAMGRTSPLQTPGSSPAYVPEDGASPYVTEAGSPASPKGFLPASPEIREQDLASPDMDDMYTSPSYTPHDYPEAAPEPSAAAGETLVSVHESYEPSQLFEHSDDEADNEPSTVEQPQLPLASDSGRVHSPTSPGE
eukprot:CAMPEP_0177312394 /NCGR_PEP_ID=MMETSP0368-20130122/10862_1 /TAXON_ID=447022 ORGANISM="Scrippsiella hangoei-like, Strain SHHI-4" /NCGR_SAMPLE_ID=MMETSP0368 /ASSEMBLY_ACC=CAM_ASM_000363 /LENGTH=1657 /DNA_ID=CAMNT_0018771443 /DNA_START=18 /DNA_END=4992 /DNA_ORIENTATION=+